MSSSKRSIHSRKRSTEAMEPLEDLILGDCPKSGRAMETYDCVLNKPICANCLMFGDSKGHET